MRTEDLREWKKASFTENRVDCGIEKTDGGVCGVDLELNAEGATIASMGLWSPERPYPLFPPIR